MKGKTNIVSLLPILVSEPLDAVHLGPDVLSHGTIKASLFGREFVFDRIGPALWEKRPAIEFQELFLGQATHHVGAVRVVHTVAKTTFKPVTIKKSHKQLEVLFLAVVWRGRHQEKMSAHLSKKLPELITFGIFYVTAEEAGGHAMCFIADDQIPFI